MRFDARDERQKIADGYVVALNKKRYYRKLCKTHGERCCHCGSKDQLTMDHIIPQLTLRGLNLRKIDRWSDFENLQLLCAECNHKKGSYLEVDNPKTKKLLIKYINQYL